MTAEAEQRKAQEEANRRKREEELAQFSRGPIKPDDVVINIEDPLEMPVYRGVYDIFGDEVPFFTPFAELPEHERQIIARHVYHHAGDWHDSAEASGLSNVLLYLIIRSAKVPMQAWT
jgi:hypothetical protein